MLILHAIFALLLQAAPAPHPTTSVIVGLIGGHTVALDHPQFAGFIETRPAGDSVLIYRQKNVRGELNLSSVQRIDFGYKNGKPFPLSVTLSSGEKMQLDSASRNYVTVKGTNDTGSVTINHPNPLSTIVKISSKPPNRKKDLTIQYLEFPAK